MTSPPVSPSARQPVYSWYVVAILTLANVSAYVDRQILTLLVHPIKRDLQLTDSEVSLLGGLSFALFYTVLGFPIARLADQRSRRAIIAWGIGIWSLMTAACGAARNFGQLLLARVGVGVGEAALSPPAYSLIADYFPRERLGTAISVYTMGTYLGVGLAQLIGGAVIAVVSGDTAWSFPVIGFVRPWQVAFFVVGLPGLLVAALMFTVREPRRNAPRPPAVPVSEIVAHVRRNARTMATHHVGAALIALVNYGYGFWLPTFFERTHGWTPSRAGYLLGVANLTFGIAGVSLAGRLSDKWQSAGMADAKLRVCMLAAVGLLVCDVITPLMPTATLAAIMIFPLSFFASAPFGVAAAAVQEMVPARMRAQASAMYLFVVSLLGLAAGPTAVALVTDYVFQDEQMVRYSMALVALLGLIPAALLLRAARGPYLKTVGTAI
jgi:MFS family permease